MTRYPYAVALCGPFVLMGCHDNPSPAAPQQPRAVSVGEVTAGQALAGQVASGQLVAHDEVAVVPDVSGYRVSRVLVEEDAQVRQGQVLATLDSALLAPQIAQAGAQLAQQRVAAERARAESERVAGLDGKGVLSDEAIAERRLAVRTGLAQEAASRAQLDNLLVQRRALAIRAPRGGRVLQRSVRVGDTSQTGTIMFTIARDGLVELDAELPEASAGAIKLGTPVTVQTADGTRWTGQVRLVGARVDPESGTVRVRIALPADQRLRVGGFAKAMFGATAGTTLSVPETAIRYNANGATVQTVDGNRRVRSVAVRTGARAGGRVALLSGPPEGTRVVLSGGAFLNDGDQISSVAGAIR